MSSNGREIAAAVWNYEHGDQGVILSRDPNLARQHPADYIKGAEVTIKKRAGRRQKEIARFLARQLSASGVDTTGSTPLPVDAGGQPLAFAPPLRQKPGGAGLALEGPHRRRRSGGNHRAGQKIPPAISGQVRRRLLQRMVLQQDSALPAHRPGSFRRRGLMGRTGRLCARPR